MRPRRRPRISPITRRILAVNVLALGLLGLGLLYLGEYQLSLIAAQLDALRTQGQIFAAALGEGAVIDSLGEGETLIPELGRQMMRRLVEPTHIRGCSMATASSSPTAACCAAPPASSRSTSCRRPAMTARCSRRRRGFTTASSAACPGSSTTRPIASR
jgi:hypothetical protein